MTTNGMQTKAAYSLNPNGIPSLSPGLRAGRYLGLASPMRPNPERVASHPRRALAPRFNPFRVDDSSARPLRVAPASQPWAEGGNPVGIETRAVRCAARSMPVVHTPRSPSPRPSPQRRGRITFRLSPGRGAFGGRQRQDIAQRWITMLPLPKGEGRGEGERGATLSLIPAPSQAERHHPSAIGSPALEFAAGSLKVIWNFFIDRLSAETPPHTS